MAITFRETTRRNGKIFIRLEEPGQGELDVSQLHASCSTQDGTQVPCRLDRDTTSGSLVVTLAVLHVPQTVTVNGPQGILAQKTVVPRQAQLLSALNRVTHNATAASICNADDRAADAIRVELTDVMTDRDQSILRGSLTFDDGAPDAVDRLTVRVLDGTGHEAQLHPWFNMGSKSKATASSRTHHVEYSLRIPAAIPAFAIWVQLAPQEGTLGPVRSGLLTCEDFFVADMRRNWLNGHVTADRDPAYEDWFLNHHRATPQQLATHRTDDLAGAPTFSIVVPLFRTPLPLLSEMAASTLEQTYGRFELILVNASPEDVSLAATVSELARADSRVRVITAEKNLGITGNTNLGVAAATGDFVCFLDHDDTLDPDALYWYARGVLEYPETDLLYCDADQLRDGHYCDPFFKPDWSPDLLCGVNYVCHFLCIRRSLLEEIGPQPSDYDGAQDHNLTLLAGERARNVYHARRVLYHWRVAAGSTAEDLQNKSYAVQAGVHAVQDHFDRLGIPATVTAATDPLMAGNYQVAYHFGADAPLVSIVIPNKDLVPVLDRCLTSIAQKTTYPNYEVVIVENNSTEPDTFAYYEKIQHEDVRVRVVTLPSDGTFNFSRTINCGANNARGEYILMLNNDTEVITPNWIEQMMGCCQRPDVGIVGAKLLYPDGTMQHGGVGFDNGPGHLGYTLPGGSLDYYHIYQLPHDLSMVTGACLLCPASLYREVGGLDETFAVDFNDVDFCLKVRKAGYLVVFQATVELYHYESVSRGLHDHDFEDPHRTATKEIHFFGEIGRLMQRWPEYYYWGDPYLGPNVRSPFRALRW